VVGGSNPSGRAKFAKILELRKIVSDQAQCVALSRFEVHCAGFDAALFADLFVGGHDAIRVLDFEPVARTPFTHNVAIAAEEVGFRISPSAAAPH
jgi:hypothetical protein